MHTDYTTRKAKRRWVTSGNQKEEAGPEADHEGGEEITICTQWGVTMCQIQTSTPPPHTGGKLAPRLRNCSVRKLPSGVDPQVCLHQNHPDPGASWAQLAQQPPAPQSSVNRPVVTSLPADSTLCHSTIWPQGSSKPEGSGRAPGLPLYTHTHPQPWLLINSSWIECLNIKKNETTQLSQNNRD